MRNSKWILVCALGAGLALSSACGKVIQQAQVQKENPSFNLSYEVSVSTQNTDLPFKNEIYASVSSIGLSGSKKEESWGKGKLVKKEIKEKNGTQNAVLLSYFSEAFNKSSVQIEKSDLKWTYGSFKEKEKKWEFKSDKITRGAKRVLVTVYTDKDTYKMKWTTDKVISQNEQIDLGKITDYDTFLGVLLTVRFQEDSLKDQKEGLFEKLFDQTLFKKLNYVFPKNKTDDFSLSEPLFRFERQLEYDLLMVYDLAQVDPESAIKFLNELPEERLTPEVRTYLKEVLDPTLKPVLKEENSQSKPKKKK